MTNKKQEKLQETIINVTAQIVHEKHLYYIGLRNSKPSYNQLYKICAEYIDMGLQNIKNKYGMEILPIKKKESLVIDERIPNILKPSIVEYAVFEYSFYIVRGTKKKYTITASGTIKEGIESKLPEDFVKFYISLVGVVNELLEYGCMMALNQLHSTGTLYIDEELMILLNETAIEQVENDFNDTNINTKRDELFGKLSSVIDIFIAPDLEMLYGINSESKQRPFLSIEFIEANKGSDVVELSFIKGKYETVRTTGNPIDEKIVGTIGRFVDACDIVFSTNVKEKRDWIQNV